jgi:hypothetical protein
MWALLEYVGAGLNVVEMCKRIVFDVAVLVVVSHRLKYRGV